MSQTKIQAKISLAAGRHDAPDRATERTAFGRVLRDLRTARRISQLELGLRAEVSARHISFLETGRARPSRDMVARLAVSLGLPLRDRNLMLTSAGFAERYRRSTLEDPVMTQIRQALQLMLDKHEPWPALVFDASWTVVDASRGARRLIGWLLGGAGADAPGLEAAQDAPMGGSPINFLELLLEGGALADVIENWEEVLAESVERVRREVDAGLAPPEVERLMRSAEARPEVRAATARLESGRTLDTASVAGAPIIPVRFAKDGVRLAFFTTITTFGTPQDVTLQELRIESFFPADAATRAWCEGNGGA